MDKMINKILEVVDFKNVGGRKFLMALLVMVALYEATDLVAIWRYGLIVATAFGFFISQGFSDGMSKGATSSKGVKPPNPDHN